MTQDAEILALHRQLAYQKLRADLAEARATSKSQECIELRERMANSPEFEGTSPLQEAVNRLDDILQGDDGQAYKEARKALPRLRAALERESVTVTGNGPWHAEEIAQRLPPPRATVAAVTAELLAAGNAVVEHWHSRDWKKPPTADVIARLTRAVGRVKRGRELYTCVGKGGEYELVGEAKGAGTLKTYSGLIVYQDSMTGQMYCRSMTDFDNRMLRIGHQP
jgi:hypothetical protein